MKLIQTMFFILYILCNATYLQAQSTRETEQSNTPRTLHDHHNSIKQFLTLIDQAEVETIQAKPEYHFKFKNGYVRTNKNEWIENIYGSDTSQGVIATQKIKDTAPIDFGGRMLPEKIKYQTDKKILLQLSQAIENGSLIDSDLIVRNKHKPKNVEYHQSPATDENSPNITHRYDVASPCNQTFARDNSATVTTLIKTPFVPGERSYGIKQGDKGIKLESEEIRNALNNNTICHKDNRGNIINGEKIHRTLLPLNDQLKIAQEEYDNLKAETDATLHDTSGKYIGYVWSSFSETKALLQALQQKARK